MTRISINGAGGRMGGALVLNLERNDQLIDTLERPGSELVGTPVSERHPGFKGDHLFVDTLTGDCDVLIDFAPGEGLGDLVETCRTRGNGLVSGRTGFADGEMQMLVDAGRDIPVLHAGNMSLGANLLAIMSARASLALDDSDIEIIEVHHVHKQDAPSGTALMVADAIADARGIDRCNYIYGREGDTGEKSPDEIAIHSIRSGEIIGEHTVQFGSAGERFEISHHAHDRSIFALGALKAARWLAKQNPGCYTMRDVLGL